jgi:hypothetical protein
MVRQLIEQIEQLHSADSIRRDAARAEHVNRALAQCLQELRAIVAAETRDPTRRRPPLRLV